MSVSGVDFSSTTGILGAMPYCVYNQNFYTGLVLGLQTSPLTTTLCYSYYNVAATLVQSNTYQYNYEDYMTATQAKGATPTDLGYLVSFFNFISDFGLVIFNVYTYCYVDDFMQFFGKITGSQAAAGNYLNNILFTVYGYYT